VDRILAGPASKLSLQPIDS